MLRQRLGLKHPTASRVHDDAIVEDQKRGCLGTVEFVVEFDAVSMDFGHSQNILYVLG